MLGILTSEQIVHVLQSQIIGRLGCYADGKVYVIPISYAYLNNCIYGHSKEGLKIHVMRQNPSVCFEVDQMDSLVNWRSVMVWGSYEELRYPTGHEEGRQILSDRLGPYVLSETVSSVHLEVPEPPHLIEKPLRPVVFRIKIQESSGRFEKTLS